MDFRYSLIPWTDRGCRVSGGAAGTAGSDADLLPQYSRRHPTTFLVNVNTLEALPLLQGATDAAGFMARMDTVLQMYGEKHAG